MSALPYSRRAMNRRCRPTTTLIVAIVVALLLSVALALIRCVPGLSDADTLALCRRITPVVDPVAESEFPAYMSGVARVRTADAALEKVVVIARGEPESFLSDAELRAKFDDLTAPYAEPGARDALAGAVLALETVGDVREVMRLARPAAPGGLRAAGGDD